MRWGMSDNERSKHKERTRLRFAFFPTRMDDGTWVWLEDYIKSQERYMSRGTMEWAWMTHRYVDKRDDGK